MITLKFQYNNLDANEILQVFDALDDNAIFGLRHRKHDSVIIFIPEHNAVIFPPSPTTYFNLNHTHQICNDRIAFENVISISLYQYRIFVSFTQIKERLALPIYKPLPHEIQQLLPV